MLPPPPRCSGWASSSLLSPNRVSLPRFHFRIGLHIVLFEVCSAFTRVTAIRRLQTLRLLHACSGRFRLERSPGGPCTHWKSAALSRRTWKTDLTLYRDKGQQWHESTLRGRVIDDRTAPARLARAAGLFPAAAAGRPIWW